MTLKEIKNKLTGRLDDLNEYLYTEHQFSLTKTEYVVYDNEKETIEWFLDMLENLDD